MPPKTKFIYAKAHLKKSKLRIRGCYLGKVFFVLRSRVNRYGKTALIHEGLGSFRSSPEDARQWINPRRKKGTAWHIWELPAIVIKGIGVLPLVIVQGSFDAPLSEFHVQLPEQKESGMLATALMYACAPCGHDCHALQGLYTILPAEFPFRTMRTYPPEITQAARDLGERVPRFNKDWAFDKDTIDVSAAIKIVCNLCLWIARD